MRRKDRLGIISSALLVLASLLLVSCERPYPKSATPTPSRTTPSPIPTTGLTPEPASTVTPLPTYVPLPTQEASLPPETIQREEYRIVFLVDNSLTPMTECPETPQDAKPGKSQTHRIMYDVVTFAVDILAAVNSGANGELVEIGVYTIYAADADEEEGLSPWTLLPLQTAKDFEGYHDWSEGLADALDSPGVNQGGYAPAIQRLRQEEVLDGKQKQIVVLITDGYIGRYDSKTATELRDELEEELEDLRVQEQTTVHVLRFDCPGLATNENEGGSPAESIYKGDVERWNSLAGQELINQIVIPFPQHTNGYSNMLRIERPYTNVVVELLEHPSFAELLPARSEDKLSGWNWLPEDETTSEHSQLPGDTGTLRLWVVRSTDTNEETFEAVVSRDNDHDSPAFEDWSYPNSFKLDENDSILRGILDGKTSECGPITWWLEGKSHIAFYWWDSSPVTYSLERSAVTPETISNNGPMTVKLPIEAIGDEGHKDCFGVRVSLITGRQTVGVLNSVEMTLRELEDIGNIITVPGGYAYNPEEDGQLTVSIELLRHLNMSSAGTEILEQVSDWHQSVETSYTPTLHSSEGGSCTDEECQIEVGFDFTTAEYHNGEEPQPEIFLLSSHDPEAFKALGQKCDGYQPNVDIRRLQDFKEDVKNARQLGVSHQGQAQLLWYEPIAGDDLLQFKVAPIQRQKIKDCGYASILVQWTEGWPAVLCTFGDDAPPTCSETNLRISKDTNSGQEQTEEEK